MFNDRQDAGRRLASALLRYRNQDVVIVGLPRGGVPVALEIAKVLDAPMTMIFVRKIGVPGAPEVAMGAVVDGARPYVLMNGDIIHRLGISDDVFQSAMEEELKEIARRKALFKAVVAGVDLEGKIVMLVDDGIATGATMTAAAVAIQQYGVERLVIAVPVAPRSVIANLEDKVEDVICLEAASSFRAVGDVYHHFPQLSDDDVIDCFRQYSIVAADRM
ncbi:phosphoribosyltransferase [Rhizobium leguminosarum bv. viciae]|nr:phosphoribosyltransferase [Rhizobium leguminosarum bv. viciae]